jgi:ribonucleotide reductase beta subunit family protein with ferritin-like domain
METILTENPNRFTIFPLKYPDLWELYKKAESSFWTSGEIDFSADTNDWENLNEDEKHFLLNILAFFAGSDGIVLENLLSNFFTEVQIPEARSFYALQAAIENIHGEVYGLLIDTFSENDEIKNNLFNAIETIPCVKKKADWAIKWMNPSLSFAHRLVAFAIVEGVFFSGSFCAIFWFKSRNKMVKTLGTSNELIARDESMHTEFAVALYHHLDNKLDNESIYSIIREAVEIEEEFIIDSIKCSMIGMNENLMRQYIRFVADRLLIQLGCPKIYNDENPFAFMETIGLDGKTNFFEKRVTEYQLAENVENGNIDFSSDF